MTDGMPAEPIPFRVLLDEAMKQTRRHFGKMYAPVAIPLALLAGVFVVIQLRFMQQMAGGEAPGQIGIAGCLSFVGTLVLFLVLGGLSSAVLTCAALDGATARPISMKEKWAFVLQPSTLVTLLLALVGITLGFILLILPGIYLLLRWSFVVPVMSGEGVKGTAGLRRSWDLVRYNPGKRFFDNTATKVFLLYLVAGLISWLVSLVVQLPFTAMQGVAAARDVASGQPGSVGTAFLWLQVPSTVLSQLVSTAANIYSSFGVVLLYLDVLRRKEGKDLASAIDARFGSPQPPAPAHPV